MVISLALLICSLSFLESFKIFSNKELLTSVPTLTEAFAAKYWLTIVITKPTIPITKIMTPPVIASLSPVPVGLINLIKAANEDDMTLGISLGVLY